MSPLRRGGMLLAGYYGQRNTGDDAFGLVATWGARTCWGQRQVALLSSRGPRAPGVRFALPEQRYRGQEKLHAWARILAAERVVFAGGSILHSKPAASDPTRLLHALSRRGISRLAAIGVSVGPYRSAADRAYVERTLRSLEFLVVRDRQSFELASELNLPRAPVAGADLAWLLRRVHASELDAARREPATLGVMLCHSERYGGGDLRNEARRERGLLDALRLLARDARLRFRFFVFNGHPQVGDEQLVRDTIDAVFGEDRSRVDVIGYSPDTLGTLVRVAECRAVLSTRLHGAIFAAIAGVPSVLVEYHRKCSDYLADVGVAARWRIGDMQVAPDELAARVCELVELGDDFDFYPRALELVGQAERNFLDVPLAEGGP